MDSARKKLEDYCKQFLGETDDSEDIDKSDSEVIDNKDNDGYETTDGGYINSDLVISPSKVETTSSKNQFKTPVVIKDTSSSIPSFKSSKFKSESFLSSKVSKVHNQKKMKREKEEESDSELNLKEAMSFIESVAHSELKGKEKRDSMMKKAADLGMPTKKENIPLKMRFGMANVHKKRVHKTIEEARDSGMLPGAKRPTLEKITNQLTHSFKPNSTSKVVATEFLKKKTHSRFRERGIKGTIGKFKGGTLYVDQ